MNAHSGERAASIHAKHTTPAVRLGVALWVVFAVVAVAARGVQWDEAYEHGQILSGRVAYPESHPLYRYVHNGFSLQTYLSAAVVYVAPSPAVLCGIRNVLFVLATVLPVYLFSAHLTGDAFPAHAAALFTLNGIYLDFDSSYPLSMWPSTFTNGYLGGGYMLLTLYMVLTRRFRVGLFLLGLAPAIHIGELPGIAGACGLFVLWQLVRSDRAAVAKSIPWGAAGLGVCIAFAIIMRAFHVPAPAEAPDPAAVQSIWQGYTQYFDPHRQFPPANAHIATVLALVLGAGMARAHGAQQPVWTWLLVFTAIIAAAAWGTIAVHAALGSDIPFLLIGWMPYRLLNLVLPILLVTIIGTLARGPARTLIVAAIAYCIAQPALVAFGGDIVQRYFASGEFLLFALSGAAIAQLAFELTGPSRRVWLASAVLGIAGLGFVHQWGTVSLLIGAAATSLVLARSKSDESAVFVASWANALGLAILAVVLLAGQALDREHLPRSEFDTRLADHLAKSGEADAMLLAHPNEFLLQARTGHPVLVETATASLMSYLPELGPSIQQTYGNLYGIRFDAPLDDANAWKTLWQQRAKQEWNALAEQYDFDFVIAPDDLPLQLEAELAGDRFTLYRARESSTARRET